MQNGLSKELRLLLTDAFYGNGMVDIGRVDN